MLDRIRRKLFLSIKVMGSDNPSSSTEESSALRSAELMDILKRGSSALSGSDIGGMDLQTFLDAPAEEILKVSRERNDVRDAKLRRELGSEASGAEDAEPDGISVDDRKKLEDAEEEERRLLSGVAQVHSRMFEGRVVQRASGTSAFGPTKREMREIAGEWKELQKRARGPSRIVMVDGMEFIVAPIEQLVRNLSVKYTA